MGAAKFAHGSLQRDCRDKSMEARVRTIGDCLCHREGGKMYTWDLAGQAAYSSLSELNHRYP